MMKRFLAPFCATLLFLPIAGFAQATYYQGRTGLPTVRAGKSRVSMVHGVANLNVDGTDLITDQEYQLKRVDTDPSKDATTITMGVREDCFKSQDTGGKITVADAKGFNRFEVKLDGKPVQARADLWKFNQKKDTATRTRSQNTPFEPGPE